MAQTSVAKADHYSHIAHCIMCMKGCHAAKRQQCYYALYCPLWWNATPKGSGSLPVPRSGHATAIMFLFIFSSYPTQIIIKI